MRNKPYNSIKKKNKQHPVVSFYIYFILIARVKEFRILTIWISFLPLHNKLVIPQLWDVACTIPLFITTKLDSHDNVDQKQ